MPKRGLTSKQQIFVAEYLVDLNATQAAIRAGYSAQTAQWIGPQLLNKTHVMAEIAKAKLLREKSTGITSDYVLSRLAEIDQMDAIDILNEDGTIKPIKEWPKIWRQYISGFEVQEIFGGGGVKGLVGMVKKIKWPEKIKNLELIGRHVNVQAWKEKIEVSGSLTIADRLARAKERLRGSD